MIEKSRLKVAIVYEWFYRKGGAERVVDALLEIFPNADIYALSGNNEKLLPLTEKASPKYSFLQKIPFSKKIYRYLYFLMPSAIELLDLSGYDLVISSSHCVAKGIIVPKECIHISYISSPMRYGWDLAQEYFNIQNFSKLKLFFIWLFIPYLRIWDYLSTARIDYSIVNSHFTGKRYTKYYRRPFDAIIYPPVDITKVSSKVKPADYYVSIAPFEPNKYGDIIVKAAMRYGFKLKLIGDGSQKKKLQKLAKGFKNIEFLEGIDDTKKFEILSRARGYIAMGVEDFGIAPVEAQACGVPVIAYKAGGILETVINDKTGILLPNRSVESLGKTLEDLEIKESMHYFNRDEIRNNSLRFSKERFLREMEGYINMVLENGARDGVRTRDLHIGNVSF